MTSIGIDMIETERIQSAVSRWGERFLNRIYTEAELRICQGRVSSLASRFAGKEAVMKVLGTGTKGVMWREIEILADARGKPEVELHGGAKDKARELNLNQFSISLSDTEQHAIAVAIGT
ncbi:MAG: holo-ACP synthase [Dehalococcoidia bacterium]|nr:holo-ACP synthase [Chloroflexota bacterium]MCK4221821.1 holo-ACP synthase [Dehalococcoidia bacterium]